jgi:hypothetical protein
MATTALAQNDPDLLYININVTNLDNNLQIPKPLYYQEVRSSPLLYCPSNFYMSIVKFTLDTQTLPIMLMPIVPNQADINLSSFVLGFTYQGDITLTTYTSNTNIIYIPQITAIGLPAPPSSNNPPVQDNSQGYYNIFNYEYFIELINTALATAYTNLGSQVIAGGDTSLPLTPPTITWNNSTSTATISYSVTGLTNPTINSIPQIIFNTELYSYLSSFNSSITSFGANPNVILKWVAPITGSIYTIEQEYDTTVNWNPINGIVFTSNSIPVVAEALSAPLLTYNNNNLINSGNNNVSVPVITDFSTDGRYKPSIYYVPTSQYRYTQLQSDRPLNTIDISVYYRIKTGELIPFVLASGGNLFMKILFQKKGTINMAK